MSQASTSLDYANDRERAACIVCGLIALVVGLCGGFLAGAIIMVRIFN